MILNRQEERCDRLAAELRERMATLKFCQGECERHVEEVAQTPLGLASSFCAGTIVGLLAPGKTVSALVSRGLKMGLQILASARFAQSTSDE